MADSPYSSLEMISVNPESDVSFSVFKSHSAIGTKACERIEATLFYDAGNCIPFHLPAEKLFVSINHSPVTKDNPPVGQPDHAAGEYTILLSADRMCYGMLQIIAE